MEEEPEEGSVKKMPEEKSEEAENVPPAVCIEELVDQNIQVPAGSWRLAKPHPKADVLFMRFATKGIVSIGDIYLLCKIN